LSLDERIDLSAPGVSARNALADFPLGGETVPPPLAAPAAELQEAVPEASATAPLSVRAIALAADLAGTSLAVTAALMGAVAATGNSPRLAGLPWAAAFGVGFSFVFVVVPLALFGRTVGMSLAGIASDARTSGRRLTAGEAARRWTGTAVTVLGLGLPILFTMRDPARPTPADRFSSRSLIQEAE
jgi:uncharacterized RDD family membrane protein YckC